jgi:hypothetical protein
MLLLRIQVNRSNYTITQIIDMSYQYETSLPAYKEAKINLNYKQKKVLEAIINITTGIRRGCNDRETAKYLGWTINTVTPRRGELQKAGKIYEVGKFRDDVNGRKVMYFKPTENQLSFF